jgi:hypothetical protein
MRPVSRRVDTEERDLSADSIGLVFAGEVLSGGDAGVVGWVAGSAV